MRSTELSSEKSASIRSSSISRSLMGSPFNSLSVESSNLRNLTEFAKSLAGRCHSSIGLISVLFLDLLLLKRRSISSYVMSPFFGLVVAFRGLLLMVLLSLAELFFHRVLVLIARRILVTSVVWVRGTYFRFFPRPACSLFCIITTIIIIIIYLPYYLHILSNLT